MITKMIMQECSAEVEQERTAEANKSAAVFKSGDQVCALESGGDEVADDGSEIPNQAKNKAHCFCPKLARDHGEHAAVILQGLGYKVAKSRKVYDERKWHYDTLAALETRWPYLTDSGIGGILDRHAANGEVFKGRYNKWGIDRTNWYSLREDLVKRAMSEEGKLWFDVHVAVQCHSIVAGTLYQNLRYQLLLALAQKPECGDLSYHRVNKSALAKTLPWSLSTIKRAYRDLETADFVEKNPRCPMEYTICNRADLIVPESMRKFSKSSASAEMASGSFTEMTRSSTELTGSSTEKNGSTTENNTHYKPFQNTVHKHHSPHAARAVCGVNENAAGAEDGIMSHDRGYEHGSPTGTVEENSFDRSAAGLIPRYKPQSVAELHRCIDFLSGSVSDADKALIKGFASGLAPQYVTMGLSFFELRAFSQISNADELVQRATQSVFQWVEEHGINSGWKSEARDLCFLRHLYIVVGAFLLCTCTGSEVEKQLPDRVEAIWDTYVAIPRWGDHEEASANDKADSFLAEIKASNRNGWPTTHEGELEFTVQANEGVREMACQFFNENPHLTTTDVWRTLSDCVEAACLSDVPEGFDQSFYARRGIRPKFLLENWSDVNADLAAAENAVSPA